MIVDVLIIHTVCFINYICKHILILSCGALATRWFDGFEKTTLQTLSTRAVRSKNECSFLMVDVKLLHILFPFCCDHGEMFSKHVYS